VNGGGLNNNFIKLLFKVLKSMLRLRSASFLVSHRFACVRVSFVRRQKKPKTSFVETSANSVFVSFEDLKLKPIGLKSPLGGKELA
jgi:alpha-acetolactate decarboxylase